MSASRLRQARRADRSQLKARVAIDGPTGAGKTWTALVWATELAGPDGRIIVLDTEHGSAEWYSDHFDYDVVTWAPPYAPNELADTIAEAATKYDVVVTDSFSHFWEGEGGTRDIVDAAAERSRGNSFAGWKVGTPALRRLIDTILAADAHVICTMRSKMEYVLEEDDRGRQVPKKIGMAPVMRQGVEYEFTLIADMDLEHRMMVTKSRCPALADQMYQPHMAADGAKAFLAWLNDGVGSISEADADRLAEALNELGQDARKAWLDTFNCKPTALPENRLAEAEAFVGRLAAPPASAPSQEELQAEADVCREALDEMADEVAARQQPEPGPEPDPEPPEGGPGGGVDDAGGAPDSDAGDITKDTPAGVDGANVDEPPASSTANAAGQRAPRGLTARQVAQKAGVVFKADYDAAPRGSKTRLLERLRHALTFAQTKSQASLAQCNAHQLLQVWNRLEDICEGRLTYEIQHGDDGGVTWISQTGRRTTVMWAEAEMAANEPGEAA